MNQEFTKIGDHIEVLIRRRLPFFVTFVSVVIAATLLAFKLPAKYESEARILIEGQEIPQEFVQSTITTFADKQIQIIAARVMTRDNLEEIINEFELFDASGSALNMESAVRALRGSIVIAPVRATVVNQRTNRTNDITIAFTVGFQYSDPEVAQNVTTKLSRLFLAANKADRAKVSSQTTEFLEAEAKKLNVEILQTENRMAAFKQKNSDSLPELSGLNFQQLQRTERDLETTERDIRTYQGRQAMLQAELRTVAPYASSVGDGGEIISTEERMTRLQRELLQKSAIYSDDHPDIVRLNREIDLLSGTTGSAANVQILAAELEAKTLELNEARRRYSNDHPDVVRLEANVTNLETRLTRARNAPQSVSTRPPDNPRYLQIQAELDLANQELSALYARRTQLRQDMDTYDQRLTQTPQTEREWLRLTRDYEVSVAKYRQIRSQIDAANRAETLESEQKGERFTLIQAAQLPIQPISPNRPLILFAGLIFAIALSAGIVIAMETFDTSVRGSKDIISILGAPPLATIPVLKNRSDVAAIIRDRILITAAFAGAIGLTIIILI